MKIPIRLAKYTEDGVNKARIERMDVLTSKWQELRWCDGDYEKEVCPFYNGLIASGVFTERPTRIQFDGKFYCVMYWCDQSNAWKQDHSGGFPLRYNTADDAVESLNSIDDTGYNHTPQPCVVILENKQV